MQLAFPQPLAAILWEPIHIGVDVLLGVGMAWLHAKASRIEKLEEQVKADAKEQVRLFLLNETGGLRLEMAGLEKTMADHAGRLAAGDDEFKQMQNTAFEQRMEIVREIHALALNIQKESVTRAELLTITAKVDECVTTIAGVVARFEASENRRPQRGS